MLFDLFFLFLLIWAVITGWRNGLLKELISSLGFFIGLIVAAVCYSELGDFLVMTGTEANVWLNIVAFFLLWIIVPIFLGFIASILTKAIKSVHLGWANSLAGALVATAKYLLLLSCVLNVMSFLRIIDEERKQSSVLITPIESISELALTEVKEELEDEQTTDADTLWVNMQDSLAQHP